MCELVCRLSVGCHDEYAFGHVVEAPDVCETGLVIDQIEDSLPSTRIGFGCENACRFIENDPVITGGLRDSFSVDGYLIDVNVDALSRSGNYAVDANFSGGDELFSATT
jgi:hypothetical protein